MACADADSSGAPIRHSEMTPPSDWLPWLGEVADAADAIALMRIDVGEDNLVIR